MIDYTNILGPTNFVMPVGVMKKLKEMAIERELVFHTCVEPVRERDYRIRQEWER